MKTGHIVASYLEIDALPDFLSALAPLLDETDVVVIADDSPQDLQQKIKSLCEVAVEPYKSELMFSFSNSKGGRGKAIRRGMNTVLMKYPEIEFLIEMDADSSHQPRDVKALRDCQSDADLVIGSRYLKNSQIIGWPTTRKIFSRILNLLIPRLFGLKIKDVTNGLRRYKVESAKIFLALEPQNSGFTYLSEQAIILQRSGKKFEEIPIIFINRTLGKSTVTYKEIINSLRGIFSLLSYDHRIAK